MFSKLSFSISAALVLFAGVVRAAPKPTNAEIQAAEAGIPDSTDYAQRMFGRHSPTNDELGAAETGSPDSVDNRNQMKGSPGRSWQEDWQALEFGNPDFR
jgi:hypothetical protein